MDDDWGYSYFRKPPCITVRCRMISTSPSLLKAFSSRFAASLLRLRSDLFGRSAAYDDPEAPDGVVTTCFNQQGAPSVAIFSRPKMTRTMTNSHIS